MAEDPYDQVTVRIYRKDWRTLHRLQLEQEPGLRRKPSLAEIIAQAVKRLEEVP